MKNFVYIIHGYDSGVDKNWFAWLKAKLEKLGIESSILPMPNPKKPVVQMWLDSMQRQVKRVDSKTYFIGHSLGTISVLHFLQSLDSGSNKIGGYILVSGFCEHVKGLEMLNSFVDFGFDFKKLKAIAHNRLVISARDDSIVPSHFSQELARRLDSDFLQTASGGHFMQSEGYTTFPLLLNQLEYFLKLQDEN